MDGLDGMFLYLNNHQTDDTYSRIIIYLLNNRDKIALTNITDLANNCYVSISTISRFSKFFGYGSFQLMKESLKKDPSLDFKLRLNKDNYYNLDHAPEHFLSDFGNQIIASIQDTINTVDINAVDTLIQDIVRYDHVYLFGYDSTLDLLKRFQSAFLLNNKLLFMAFPDDLQLELSKKLDETHYVSSLVHTEHSSQNYLKLFSTSQILKLKQYS